MEVITGNDICRYVTNFYVSPTMEGLPDCWGSKHGLDSYNKLKEVLQANDYKLSTEDAWILLDSVSQPPTKEITSQTQLSSLYNFTERSLRLATLRKFGTQYNFKIE